jgi:hypothetical protein
VLIYSQLQITYEYILKELQLMKRVLFLGLNIILIVFGLLYFTNNPKHAFAQQPTGSVPTVTSTPLGPIVEVTYKDEPQINVRSGPGTTYPRIGVLVTGQQVPALGRSPGGDWILIYYPGVAGNKGWVYAPFVSLPLGGTLPIIEPPPTPTPQTTPTIDPTLQLAYSRLETPTRLPTFTPAPLIAPPLFSDVSQPSSAGGVPSGFIIVALLSVGIFGSFISFLRGG